MKDAVFQRCISPACAATCAVDDIAFVCPRCGGLLDVAYDWDRLSPPRSLRDFETKWADRLDPAHFSGVWRYRELLPFAPPGSEVTIGEGQTLLQVADKVGQYVGMNPGGLRLQYEGLNPSGSFKDNGMTAAFTHARQVGARRAPTIRAWVKAAVMPLSLKLPEGFMPSYCRNNRPGSRPT